MMKLKFDPRLEFQIAAINSIVDLFRGQNRKVFDYTLRTVPNILTIPKERMLENLKDVQNRNNLPVSNDLGEPPFNFTIEMETGTGKTYVYLRTILELNTRYGFTKFIIVVPSVAIKEGVLKTLEITEDHLGKLYDNLPYSYFSYESENLVQIRMFAQDTNLQLMIITRDAFNKDINIIHNVHDRIGDKPVQLIKQTNPIIVLDEPQKMEGEASKWGISELNPLFILRYSATHREVYNLVYKLTPYDAYNLGLVKKIEVLSVTEEGEASSKKIVLEKIDSTKSGLKARVKVFAKEKKGIRFKTIVLKHGEDLSKKTNNEYYEGFRISEINKGAGYISFSNGVRIQEGKSSIDEDEIITIMVRETIREHLEKKRRLNPKRIKVLSLFFINRVHDYLPKDGWLRNTFEKEFKALVEEEFHEFSVDKVDSIHKGYFSEMRSEKSIEEDEDAYDLIMKEKERLLSLDEPVEFIFSHSALREGWDNPNVFNICTLVYSTSEMKKRQEVGRGLRLPVDTNGERIQDREINLLTVVSNETYREYVDQLQTEFREEVGVEAAPPVENKRKRKRMMLKNDVLTSAPFESLWARISKKANYVIDIDAEDFVRKCVKEINEVEVLTPEITVQKRRIESIDVNEAKDEFIRESSIQLKPDRVFNIVKHIENETKLTKLTIFKILNEIHNLNLLFESPQRFTEKVVGIINNNLKESSVENIKYVEIGDKYAVSLFNNEIQTYEKYIVSLDNKKTVYKIQEEDKDAVPTDSKIEEAFAKEFDGDSRVKLFIKLPDWYKIETPAGNYNPDWAAVVEKTQNGISKEEIYFVVETKGTLDMHLLRPDERVKMLSAKRRFAIVKDVRFIAPIDNWEHFTQLW